MEIAEYKNIFKHESTHFFYITIHNLVLSLLKNYAPKKEKLNILDAGCGTGLLAKKLSAFGEVIGIDVSNEALKFAKLRKIRIKKASISKLPFSDNTFEVIVSIDVIYHREITNDQIALNELFRVLKPNGILILRVPAYEWLNLAHDKLVYTGRRYSRKNLYDKLLKAKFKVEKISFVNAIILPLAILQFIQEKIFYPKKLVSSIKPVPKYINKLLILILSLEAMLIEKTDLPFGIGLITVARKKNSKPTNHE